MRSDTVYIHHAKGWEDMPTTTINAMMYLVNAVEHMNVTHYRNYDLQTWHATYSTLMGAMKEVMREGQCQSTQKIEVNDNRTWFNSEKIYG